MMITTALALMLQAQPVAAPQIDMVCGHAGKERTVKVMAPAGDKACVLEYGKPDETGTSEILWSANNDPGYCATKVDGFVEKLETWGWSCAARVEEAPAAAMTPAPEATDVAVEPATAE